MIKKIFFAVIALLLIAGGIFYITNSVDNYDEAKYSVSISPKLESGAKIDLTLPDQFDKSHSLQSNTRKLILTFSKDTSHIVKDFLKEREDNFLEKRDLIYLADISPMPVVIRNAFAMPDLKKSAYPVLLMYKDKIASKFRNTEKKESIMIIILEDKTVTDIKYADDPTTLLKMVE